MDPLPKYRFVVSSYLQEYMCSREHVDLRFADLVASAAIIWDTFLIK